MKKRYLFLLIVGIVLMLVPLLATADIIDSGDCGPTMTWELDDKGLLSITGSGYMTSSPWKREPLQNSIKKVEISEGVLNICELAFGNCYNLSEVDISQGLLVVERAAFWFCTGLEKIFLPNSVTSIGESAFYHSGLKTFIIPEQVTTDIISKKVFEGCNNLSEMNVVDSNPFFSSQDGILFNKEKTILLLYPQGKDGNEYIVHDGVSEIGESAFRACKNLVNIVLSNSVKKIGGFAFDGCENLHSIQLSQNLTRIEDAAFQDCFLQAPFVGFCRIKM